MWNLLGVVCNHPASGPPCANATVAHHFLMQTNASSEESKGNTRPPFEELHASLPHHHHHFLTYIEMFDTLGIQCR